MTPTTPLERIRTATPDAVRLDARQTWRAALALGIELSAAPGHRIAAEGADDALDYLAPAIAQHRRTLRAGACRICRDGLAEKPARLCAYCHARRAWLLPVPGSPEEHAILEHSTSLIGTPR